ncbi:SMP-30/gluconolactonase/LRE family protein [Roseomonas sp. BN140053]|uniref:SMP-30/gluconolactonase/LRE family protein n=1 Tax=Roseomonas sp. BN140053 TaxID=3391898 RepID=UPI0039EA0537
MSLYAPPREVNAELFTVLPPELRWRGEPSFWERTRPGGAGAIHSFLEGPAFDREGHLWCTDIPHGRLFRIDPAGRWTLAAQYEGEPNGLKIHRDGRIFLADREHGLLVMDPVERVVRPYVTRPNAERFRGLNDLFFGPDGSLYLTDPGRSHLGDPTGRVYRVQPDGGSAELLIGHAPTPNGLVLDHEQRNLVVGMTRGNAVWRFPVSGDAAERQVELFIQLSGGLGPDGLALDEAGNLAVVHARNGTVWLFSPEGEPRLRIRSCSGKAVTNIAYGGPDRRDLFILEASSGSVMRARMEVPGRALYSHT